VGWIVAAAKRYTAEQIVAKLREAEKLQGQGMTIPQTCKRLRISEQTFYRWRTKLRRVEGRRGASAQGARAGERQAEADHR
jgi:transposase